MKKFHIFLTILIIAIITAVVGIYVYQKTDTLILQGEVEVKKIDLSSKIPARVKRLNVQKGDYVKKGQVLAELDMPEVNAKAEQANALLTLALAQQEKVNNGARSEQIAMAKANYDVMKKTYDRMTRLYKEGVIPAQKLDETTAKYQASKEAYEMLKNGSRKEDKESASAGVKHAKGLTSEVSSYVKEEKIVAPINGVITEVNIEEAELVGAGYPIITLVDNNDCWVTFNMREDLLPKIKNGTEFDVNIPAIGEKPIKVKVNYISVMGGFANWRATKTRGDFDMKTFEVRAVPVEPISDLRAGMSAVFDWKKLK